MALLLHVLLSQVNVPSYSYPQNFDLNSNGLLTIALFKDGQGLFC